MQQHDADTAGPSMPATRNEALAVDAAQGFWIENSRRPDSSATKPEKRIATARARAALLGATLHVVEDDDGAPSFILTMWGSMRELTTLDAVEQMLDRLQGVRR